MMKLASCILSLSVAVALLVTGSDAFAAKAPKAAQAADKAVAIFGKKFPFGRAPAPSSDRVRFGMPNQDFDGTVLMKAKYKNPGKRLTDISEKDARASFVELAKCYGDEAALDMVKAMPICLSFNRKNYKPSLDAFSEIFGEEEAKGMVQRNPGLLALNPKNAETATDQTLYFSYIVGATRPVGGLLLGLLSFALLSLPLQAATGIVLREEILKFFQ